MKMGKSIKKNYIYNMMYQLLTLISPLITAPYLSRVLGAECIGRLSYVESITSYFVLFAALGVSTYGAREISYVQDDKEKRSEVFWNTKFLTLITVLICIFIYFLFIYFYKKDTKLFLIAALLIINCLFDVTWFFQGLEEFGKIVLRNTVIKVINIAYIFIFVHSVRDFYLYVIGLYGIQAIGSILLWPLLKKLLVAPKEIKPFKNFKVILSLFVPTIAISIYTVLDKTMIGIFTVNAVENGYYDQALKLSKMLLTIVTSLGIVMVPRIGSYFGKGDDAQIKFYMYRSYRFVFLLGIPLYLGVFVGTENMVPWFFGPGYEKVIPLLRILGLLILAIGINNVTGVQYLIPTKRQNLFTMTVLIGACLNLILNLILIPRFYSIGAAIASVIAETTIAIVQLILVRKELSFKNVLYESWKYLVSGFIMFGVLFFISKYMQPSILNSSILFITGIATYFMMLFILRDDFFINNVNKVIKKILKRK